MSPYRQCSENVPVSGTVKVSYCKMSLDLSDEINGGQEVVYRIRGRTEKRASLFKGCSLIAASRVPQEWRLISFMI